MLGVGGQRTTRGGVPNAKKRKNVIEKLEGVEMRHGRS